MAAICSGSRFGACPERNIVLLPLSILLVYILHNTYPHPLLPLSLVAVQLNITESARIQDFPKVIVQRFRLIARPPVI